MLEIPAAVGRDFSRSLIECAVIGGVEKKASTRRSLAVEGLNFGIVDDGWLRRYLWTSMVRYTYALRRS